MVTAGLVLVALWQSRITRRSLQLSIQPLLADHPHDPDYRERVNFGPPGRTTTVLDRGQFWWDQGTEGIFMLSVAFQNIGAGVAAIVGVTTDPDIPTASFYPSRNFVSPGEEVRVNISVLVQTGTERYGDEWWAMGGLAVVIRYSDAEGKRNLASRAEIEQQATHPPWVARIVFQRKRRGWWGYKSVARGIAGPRVDD